MTFYVTLLAVPARREVDDPAVRRGAALFAAAGRDGRHADAEVRAAVFVTLNGRPSRRFVDPDADLAGGGARPVLPR